MKKDSSKTILVLSIILLLVIAITLIITLNKYGVLTGRTTYSNDTATANLTISEQASLRFTTATCDFGSGSVDEEPTYAIVYSNGTSTINGTWTPTCTGLVVQNDGDVDLSVAFSSSAGTAEFITSSTDRATPYFNWKSVNDTTCKDVSGCITTFTEITADTPADACKNLTWAEESGAGGSLTLHFELYIPEDALGTKGAVITAIGTSI